MHPRITFENDPRGKVLGLLLVRIESSSYQGLMRAPPKSASLVSAMWGFLWRCCTAATSRNLSPCGIRQRVKMHQSLENIWNGPEMMHLRDGFANRKALPELCANCRERSSEIGLPDRLYPVAHIQPALAKTDKLRN
jgi:hypothetical protein